MNNDLNMNAAKHVEGDFRGKANEPVLTCNTEFVVDKDTFVGLTPEEVNKALGVATFFGIALVGVPRE